ncbi:Dual specificity protein phosphatase 23 [Lamellibrachia satsuma]|nr:Dual specificity protein phosphatase 23 [Lamellibrachia satsuma]
MCWAWGLGSDLSSMGSANCNAMAGQQKVEKPDNFSWLIENVLAGSALPYRVGHFQYLLNHGIRHLVTLTEFKPPMHLAPPGLAHVFMPVVEFEAPSVEQLETFVSLVDTTRERKEAVVVHCHWGRGRTGTMLAAYLVKDQGMDAQTAIREVRRLRPRSVETREQEGAVANYAKKLKSSQAGTY